MTGKPRIGGLGRGLGALIPTAAPRETAAEPPSEPPASPAPDDSGTADGAVTASVTASSAEQPPGPEAETTTEATTGSGPSAAATADLVPVTGAEFAELRLDEIRANAKQPRQVFDEDALAELTHSVREFGVLQPVVVRPVADGYELVMGERRLRAAVAAGLDTIPAIVRSTADG